MAGNIVGFLKSTISFLDKRAEEIGIITLGLILISSMTFSILARYFVHTTFFSVASHWMEEVAKYSFIWLLYFGASLATRSGGHFKVTAQFSVLPKKARKYASLPGDLIWLIFNLFIIKLGFDLCQASAEASLSLQLPMKWVYAIIPISFILILFRLIQYNYRLFISKRSQKGGESWANTL
jgi:TRAP-type C4-dicarboxylate transport system permease small subunit